MKAQITTPIYYPNAKPHLGHAYTTIAADTLARWLRRRGVDVRLVTGTDEHAEKIVQAATAAGESPEAFVERMRVPFKEMMARIGVDMRPDRFAFHPTHEEGHIADVKRFFSGLLEAGQVYKGVYKGWYNVRESAFVPELEAQAAKFKDPLTGAALEQMEEEAWFFKMREWAPKVAAHIRANPSFVRPESRRNEVLARLEGEVADLCVSRPRKRHEWGVAMPGDDDFVIYVWFDALITYLTGAGWEREGGWEERWQNTLHILGKDILWFHAGVWPAMLMAAGLPLPGGMFVHGYLTVGGEKMSKSLGNVIDPMEVGEGMGPYGAEVLRFFCLHDVPFGADASVAPEQFTATYNAFLANELGNLLHRAGTMIERFRGGEVVAWAGMGPGVEPAYDKVATHAATDCDLAYRNMRFREAVQGAWALVKWAHGHIDTQAPWALHKAGETDKVRVVFAEVANALAMAAQWLEPVLPGAARAVLSALGDVPRSELPEIRAADGDAWKSLFAAPGGAGPPRQRLELAQTGKLELPPPIFPRLETKERAPAKASPQAAEKETAVADRISIDDFAKVRLVTGEVVAAKAHPNADRLLLLEVEIGEESPRQVVAGMAAAYTPEEMVGRQVVVCANLKPAKLRGEESNGMVLAADGDKPILLMPAEGVAPGTRIK